ncbi:molybdopterin synthase catalytic subunit MoaE [Gallaecimonas mangrovi]|uniref:molybdopterin synthase catalytic subunit MoaE n=1 Tax=Gallaecimonas mangrovi TaxID=2291597 RepID=UPI000E207C7F|nr:molybdopterin synthase catalytic subunit MoaE [Gallaecimonas mangrovi]
MQDLIAVQQQDFDLAEQYAMLRLDNHQDGAVATFVGMVRDFNQGNTIKGLTLEHYPAMTDKVLRDIVDQARARWPLGRVRLIHRIGSLDIGEQIVFVGVSSRHRSDSFAACEFIMDLLKTQAPFWKKERTSEGERWVQANPKDQQRAKDWQSS